jgi:hypothetical protein
MYQGPLLAYYYVCVQTHRIVCKERSLVPADTVVSFAPLLQSSIAAPTLTTSVHTCQLGVWKAARI